MILNFNTIRGSGKTYYAMNKDWKYLKQQIKQTLDEKESCREYKINHIIGMLETYKNAYLRGDKDADI